MPRYRKSQNKKLVRKSRSFQNPYQIIHFLSSASQEEFKPFQDKAKDYLTGKSVPLAPLKKSSLHKIASMKPRDLMSHAVSSFQNDKAVGGGISSALAILLKQFGHLIGFDKIKDAVFGSKKTPRSQKSQFLAYLVDQTYNTIGERPNTVLQKFERLPDYDSKHVSVWRDNTTGELTVSVRGTQDKMDYVEDIGVLFGNTNPNSSELDGILDKLEEDFPNVKYDIACHSLGAMFVNSEQKEHGSHWGQVYMYNPASSPAQSNSFETEMGNNPQYQYFINHNDPISANLVEFMNQDTIANQTAFGDYYYSPMASHSIGQWFPDGFSAADNDPLKPADKPTNMDTAEYNQDNEVTQAQNLS